MTAPTLALGCMNFGKRTPEPEARRIVDRALEHGITVFDTANAYNDGESERIVGRALRGRTGAGVTVTVATKVGFGRVAGKPEGLSRAAVLRAADASLERLGADVIDIYYLHVPDHATPIEETIDAFAELHRAGKIRALGVSNYASWQILEIFTLCDARGLPRPVISQVIYNVLIRQLEIEYLRFAAKHRLHTTVYNPLAGGLLAGTHRPGAIPAGSRFDGNRLYVGRYWNDETFRRVEALRAIAAAEQLSLVDLAYAWIAGRPGVDSILVGPGTIEHLDAAVASCARTVSPDARAKIDELHRAWQGTDAVYAR